jgi:hypothetical protein
MTLVKLQEVVMVGVDIHGNGKAFARVDVGGREAKKVYFRQVIREEEGLECLGMMGEGSDALDNLVMGIRGFIKYDEFDEYLRANLVRMSARMGLNAFCLLTLVQREDESGELVMLILSMGKFGGSRMRGVFGCKKGEPFERLGMVVCGLSMETFLLGSQVIGGKDIVQDGPMVELEGPGAYDMGVHEVTTVLAKYGDLGVAGMSKYVHSVVNKMAKWKVFIRHEEWKGLIRLNAKKPNGYGVTVSAKFSAWSARDRSRFNTTVQRHAWERRDKMAFVWDGLSLVKKPALVSGGGGEGHGSPVRKGNNELKGLRGIEKRTKGTNLGGLFENAGRDAPTK